MPSSAVFVDTSGHSSPYIWEDPSLGTNYDLTLNGLAAGALRQGEKSDLGLDSGGLVPGRFVVILVYKPASNPTAGELVSVYWSSSPSSTAATENTANTSGADAAYTAASHDNQAELVGSVKMPAGTAVYRGYVGVIEPKFQYGMPIVINSTTPASAATTDGKVILYPVSDKGA